MAPTGRRAPDTRLALLRVECCRVDAPSWLPATAPGQFLHVRQANRFMSHAEGAHTPRWPELTLLRRVFREQFEPLLVRARAREHSAPHFIERKLHTYLRRGILAHRLLRLHCDDCAHDRLVRLSCKRRGFCPPAAAAAWPTLQRTSWLAHHRGADAAAGSDHVRRAQLCVHQARHRRHDGRGRHHRNCRRRRTTSARPGTGAEPAWLPRRRCRPRCYTSAARW